MLFTVTPPPLMDAEYPTEDYGVERIYIPEGLQVMSGHTALIYARSRHASTNTTGATANACGLVSTANASAAPAQPNDASDAPISASSIQSVCSAAVCPQ